MPFICYDQQAILCSLHHQVMHTVCHGTNADDPMLLLSLGSADLPVPLADVQDPSQSTSC